jgi:hypothetical protein
VPSAERSSTLRLSPSDAVVSAASSSSDEVLTTAKDANGVFAEYDPWLSFAPPMSLATASILAVHTWATLAAVLRAQLCVATMLSSDVIVASVAKSALRNSIPASDETGSRMKKTIANDTTTGTEAMSSDIHRPTMMQRSVACA